MAITDWLSGVVGEGVIRENSGNWLSRPMVIGTKLILDGGWEQECLVIGNREQC